VAVKRLPWKFEDKKIVLRKSEWNKHVLDIEAALCKDLNQEIETTNTQLANALNTIDKLNTELALYKGMVREVRRVTKRVEA
jgi:hypothetical protein